MAIGTLPLVFHTKGQGRLIVGVIGLCKSLPDSKVAVTVGVIGLCKGLADSKVAATVEVTGLCCCGLCDSHAERYSVPYLLIVHKTS